MTKRGRDFLGQKTNSENFFTATKVQRVVKIVELLLVAQTDQLFHLFDGLCKPRVVMTFVQIAKSVCGPDLNFSNGMLV
jgi:hypothetical protein